MQPLTVHHVSINVANVDECTAFYVDILGGVLRDDRPEFEFGGAWIDLGGAQVHLIESPVPPNLGQHFAILVDDLDLVVSELRTKGIDVDDPKPVGPNFQTFIVDPDGNSVELHQIGSTLS